MTSEQKKVANKIKKLLSLSKSNNEHEASLAAYKAHKLLKEHGMSLSDVDIMTAKIIEAKTKTGFKKSPKWVLQLGLIVLNVTYTQMLSSSKRIIFIGNCQDVEVALYLFIYLFQTVKEMTKNFTKKFYKQIPLHETIKINYSYAEGCISTIEMRLKNLMAKDIEPEVTMSGTSLVVVKGQAIDKYLEATRPEIETNDISTNPDHIIELAFVEGAKDGESVPLHKAVNGDKSQQKQIGRVIINDKKSIMLQISIYFT